MIDTTPNWVPKVHPTTRDVEADDPMEVVAEPVAGGDPAFMLRCVLEEYAWLGWDADQLLMLFRSPEYPVLNQLLAHFGEAAVRQQIDELLGGTGGAFYRTTVVEAEPDPDAEDDHDHGPELIQLTVRARNR
jgi:hypothetical protein